MFSNVPDGFMGFLIGFGSFMFLCLAFLGIIMLKQQKEEKSKSVGCGTPIIIALVISIVIGIVGAYYKGTPPEEAKKTEEYREMRAEKESHKCAICGSTEDTKQINNNGIGGKEDLNWYCTKHYADAWQYYYGDNK